MTVDLTRFRWWPTDGQSVTVPGKMDGLPVSFRILRPKAGAVAYLDFRDLRSTDSAE